MPARKLTLKQPGEKQKLYKRPNRWNDWSLVEEVVAPQPRQSVQNLVDCWYIGRSRWNPDILVLETKDDGEVFWIEKENVFHRTYISDDSAP